MHFVPAVHGKETLKKVQERVTGSVRRDLWWNGESGDLPGSFPGLIQMHSENPETSLNFNALLLYAVHAVWLKFTK